MRHRQELTFRIRGLDIEGARARLKKRRRASDGIVFVRRSGYVSMRLNTHSKYHLGPVLHGRLREDPKGLLFEGTIRESWLEVLIPWMYWIPAVLLALVSIPFLLTEGWIPLTITVPGAAALGWLAWKLSGGRGDEFAGDADLLSGTARRLLR